jgi:hypothetical protein
MRTITIAAILAASMVTPALAQSATGVGIGVAKSSSTSASQATAIGGGNATGGAGGQGGTSSATSALTINNGNTPSVQTVNTVASGTQTLRNVPTVFSPGLTAAGLETCLGSVSAGVGVVGTGVSVGSTIPDPGCAARLDARTLWSMGLKRAAVARLCLREDIYASMPEVCVQYLPQRTPEGYYAAPYRAQAAATSADWREAYAGGSIMLIEGKTGQERLCNDYDAAGQRCKKWAYTHLSQPKKTMALAKSSSAPVHKPLPKVITDPPPVESSKVTETKVQ